jgi:hypothetical protein
LVNLINLINFIIIKNFYFFRIKATQSKHATDNSRSEILKHNKIDDCWLIINNNVYDFTHFIKSHPGGSDILLARAGEDATSYFTSKHGKNAAVYKQLEKLKIGTLPEAERININDLDEPLFSELIDSSYKAGLYKIPALMQNTYSMDTCFKLQCLLCVLPDCNLWCDSLVGGRFTCLYTGYCRNIIIRVCCA